MFKRLAMLVRGLMERLFMGRSLSMEQQLLLNARPLPASTTQESPQPVRSPASKKPKAKSSTAQVGTTAQSRKPKQKLAQTISGKDGLQAQTPASPIRQPAPTKRKSKQEAAPSTSVAPKLGKKKPTARQVATVSRSKASGSKSKTAARPTRQHAK